MIEKSSLPDSHAYKQHIDMARGLKKADVVLKNAQFLDVFSGEFIAGDVAIANGFIVGCEQTYQGMEEIDLAGQYICPGFIDAHTHIESSLLTPRRFEEAVLPHGTTTVIWDPHEIANVKGIAGIDWAIEATENLDLDAFLMLPSCVPSTSKELGLETPGAYLNGADLERWKGHPRVLGLAEMMNYPGLLNGDGEVLDKITRFSQMKRDGHCPGLSGYDLNAYATCGIHSCHESVTLEEAQEKMRKGIHVLIREGSCAKNGRALLPLLNDYTSAILAICSDDRNPYDIAHEGHLDAIINMACEMGHELKNILRAATWGGAKLFGLGDRGAVAPGYLADLCVFAPKNGKNWKQGIQLTQVFKRGRAVNKPKEQKSLRASPILSTGPNINFKAKKPEDFVIKKPSFAKEDQKAHIIGIRPDQIVTDHLIMSHAWQWTSQGDMIPLLDKDILKISVMERHNRTGYQSLGLVQGFGLKSGAIATSINHDSHNGIVIGTSNEAMAEAVNLLRKINGGIVVWESATTYHSLSLPIAGLMCDRPPEEVSRELAHLKALASKLGCLLSEPFLQMSFLALPVIPELKITDRGLVDGKTFQLIDLWS